MDSAKHNWKPWAGLDVAARLGILETALELLENRASEVQLSITLENGKTLAESAMEVDSSLKDARHQLRAVRNQQRRQAIDIPDPEVAAYVHHESLGVFLLITPWNFPLATILRKLVPALAYGNTVVCKPSERTPFTPAFLFELLEESGLPSGVANLILGKSSVVGNALIRHPDLAGLSFTGSTQVGLSICDQLATRPVRLQMEMGGKNAAVVLEDADLTVAAESVVLAAFSCAGQWCTSTSRVIVERSVTREFVEILKDRVSRIHIGDGRDPGTSMGPVFSEGQRNEVLSGIQTAVEEGAQVLHGGSSHDEIDGKRGWFVEPTILVSVAPEMTIAHEEVFGPVLAVIEASDPESALAIANGTEYGLSFSVFTKSEKWAERFVNEVESGVCHVNLHTAYRKAEIPIGGWRQSGRGVPECGDVQKEFFTRLKSVYRRKG